MALKTLIAMKMVVVEVVDPIQLEAEAPLETINMRAMVALEMRPLSFTMSVMNTFASI